jgi:hypothetical protein
MTKLLAQAMVLQNTLGLSDDKLAIIQDAMRSYAADTVNVAKILIEKRETPETIRKFMGPHGLSFDGKSKLFK